MNPANSQDALNQLQQIQSQSQDPNTILANQRQQLGVDKSQETVTGLRGAINNTTKLLQQVAPSVMGRTGNSLVTNAQASRQIQNEQAPISANLNQEGTDYNQANTDLQNLQQQAQQAASGIYQGQQDKLSYAQNLYNTLYQKERDAQAAQQAEADRQEQIRQFNASQSAASSGGFNLTGANADPAKSATSASQPDPTQQKAYNDVKNLLTKDSGRIQQEYEAIKKSAGFGNAYDKIKQALIEQLYPAAKNFGKNTVELGTAIPTTVSLNPTYSGLSVGVANPGTLR